MKRSEKHICALVNNTEQYGSIRITQCGSGNLEHSSAEMAKSDQTGTSQEAQPGQASSAWAYVLGGGDGGLLSRTQL